MNKHDVCIVLLVACFVLCCACFVSVLCNLSVAFKVAERFEMIDHQKEGLLEGAYFFEEEYYCVWTKGKNASQIASTEVHEQCHALIGADRQHFCGE